MIEPVKLSALYYPFSRCINPNAVKQLLLVFDGVTFLDPVTDDGWRACLMEDSVQDTDPKFVGYSEIHNSVEELKKQKAISVVSPDILTREQKLLSSASAFSDLMDHDWCRVATRPDRFGMPFQQHNGSATWQIFKPKLPDVFTDKLLSERSLRKHLIEEGGDDTAWSLSYEAGSAISIALHLAASEQLSVAPVTDSPMHHQLLLQKLTREYYGKSSGEAPIPLGVADLLARQTVFSLMKDILPVETLAKTTFGEIVEFRKETALCRDQFVRQLTNEFAVCRSEVKPERLHQLLLEKSLVVTEKVKEYENELAKSRDKIWPNFVSSLNKTLAAGGIAGAISFQYIGGPGSVLAGSVVAAGLAFLTGLLDIQAEVNNARRSASPSVAYLSKLKNLV